MPIPETQLETWSNQGPVASSERTHKSVRNCINKITWEEDINYQIYLQGSYPNYTNIYGNSDVDLVVELKSTFVSDISLLDNYQKASFNNYYTSATYSLKRFKDKIIKQLQSCYGATNIEVNNKAILVKGYGSRLDCDVVVCSSYRKYSSFSPESYIEGICFNTEKDIPRQKIINYPKIHLKNGSTKNKSTNYKFKPTIRIFKNIKAAMIKKGYITKDTAPSYFIECLLYNSNNSNFQKTKYQDIAEAIILQLHTDLVNKNMENYLVQNEQRNLFGSENQQWDISSASFFVQKLIKFWNEF